MFTGIVEEIGKICDITRGRHSATLTIEANKVLEDAKIGDSIAVNGICLTVTSLPSGRFTADVMHETMNRTSMGKLRPGDRVGLERAMPVNGRFGGHIVAGHADGTGTIEDIRKVKASEEDFRKLALLKKSGETIKELTSKQMINYYLYHMSANNDKPAIPENLFLKEYLLAMFIDCVKKYKPVSQ